MSLRQPQRTPWSLPCLMLCTGMVSCTSGGSSSSPAETTPSTSTSGATGRRTIPRVIQTGASPLVRTDSQARTPLKVQFSVDNENDFDVDSFVWDFGDGNEASGTRVSHEYDEGGSYNVRLQYTTLDDEESDFEWSLRINDPPRVEIVDWGVLEGSGGLGFWFTATGSDIDSNLEAEDLVFRWKFEEDAVDYGLSVNHFFAEEGLYEIVLRVNDPDGAQTVRRLDLEVVAETVVAVEDDPTPLEDEDLPLSPDDSGDEDEVVQNEPLDDFDEDFAEETPEPTPEDPGVAPKEDSPPEVVDDGGPELTPEPVPEAQPEPIDDGGDELAALPEPTPEPPLEFDDTPEPEIQSIPGEISVEIDFETPLDWVDGTILRQGLDPLHVYEGNGALEFRPSPDATVELLAGLGGLMEPFWDAPEVYASWYALANVPVELDGEVVRSTLDAHAFSSAERAVLEDLQRQLDALGTPPSLLADTWYCVELSATLAEGGAQVSVAVNGQLLVTTFVPEVLPSTSLATILPLVLEAPGVREDATCWIDVLRISTLPLEGCGAQ